MKYNINNFLVYYKNSLNYFSSEKAKNFKKYLVINVSTFYLLM